jgi:hypothetical protein
VALVRKEVAVLLAMAAQQVMNAALLLVLEF